MLTKLDPTTPIYYVRDVSGLARRKYLAAGDCHEMRKPEGAWRRLKRNVQEASSALLCVIWTIAIMAVTACFLAG